MTLILWTVGISDANADSDPPQRPETELQEPPAIKLERDGRSYMCFAYGGDAERLEYIIVDYHLLFGYAMSIEQEIASLRLDLSGHQAEMKRWQSLATEHRQRSDMFYQDWLSARQRLERKDKWAWVPWGIMALVTVIESGLLITAD